MHRFARFLIVVSAFARLAVPVHAACTVSLTAPAQVASDQQYSVTINEAAHSGYTYTLTEDWAGKLFFDQVRRATVDEKPAAFQRSFRHRSTFDVPVTYRVVARNDANPADVCFSEVTVLVKADPDLDRLVRRGVIPLVGTTGGLNGSFFKTSLKLYGGQSGRLIFHPLGQQGSDNDPSIPYVFELGQQSIVIDDLMAAFGLFGVGSLDIVPEGTQQLPLAEARIYNQTAEGTFGTMEPMMIAAEWSGFDRPPELKGSSISLVVPPISEGSRVNLGIRGIIHTNYSIQIRHADGTISFAPFLSVQESMVRMGTPAQLSGPVYPLPELVPGDVVIMNVQPGAIPFYTVTDNKTNDPAINFAILGSTNVTRYND